MSSSKVIAVDLDGTLTPTDSLHEGVLALVRIKPLTLFLLPIWLARDVANLKKGVRQSSHHMLTNSDENMSLVLNSDSFRKELVLSKLKDTVDYLSAKKVYVLVSPPDLADVGLTQFNLRKEVIPYSEIKSYNASVKDIIDEKDASNVIDSKKLFCAEGVCRLTTKGFPLYDDDNHVSFLGSRIIWENILAGEIFEYDEIHK